VYIYTPAGRSAQYLNQRVNGGTWYYLGRFSFGAGYSVGTGSVSLQATGANGYVVADAVKFVPVD
jgi:hypothetical protein